MSGPVAAETRPKYAGKVEGTLLGAPVTFDPIAARSHPDLVVAELLFDPLYRMGAPGTVQPHLAAAVPVPVAGAARPTVKVQLRRGVRFHDGSQLTASDVVASLERARVQNKWLLAAVSAIRAVAADEIEIETAASVDLATLLSQPATSITKGGRDPGDKPVGTGPYALEALDRAKARLTVKAFDDHFAGRVYLDRLVLHWYTAASAEAGQYETDAIQISSRGTAVYAGSQPTYRADDVEGPKALLVYVGFGRAHAAVTGDPDFRRALDQALVRNGLAALTSGEHVTPASVPVPEEAGGGVLSPAVAAGNLSAAQASLASAARRVPALAPDRIGSLKLEILVEESRPDDKDIALRVARALLQLGIASTIATLPAPQYAARVRDGNADLWIGQLAAPVMMAPLWWGHAFAAGRDDALVKSYASGRFDGAAAKKLFEARLPIVPLMFRSIKLWHRTDIRGLAFDAAGVPCFAELFLFGSPRSTRR
ncbi:MAG: ABC transporter substrate-binding protein [Deltaproteobacteria bacterium]|nr:ABC transporter substrate-binding protein [Deltaproteobacteria bacterium]